MTSKSHAQTVKELRQCFAKFEHVQLIHQRLHQMMEYECGSEEPEMLLIVGDTGVGKTRLLRRFCRDYPRVEQAEGTRLPILYLPVPAKCTLKGLPGAMLQAFGSPFWNKGNEEDRTYQARTLLKACGVRLMVLDEINHLVDRGQQRSHYLFADWIKQFSETVRLPVAMAGIPRAKVLFKVNEQLADRASEVITIAPFGVSEPAANNIVSALKAFDGLLEGIDRVPLTSPGVAQQFAFATAGRLRGIRRILVRSVELTAKMEKPRIDHSVLADAFRAVIFPGAPDRRNPFVTNKFDGTPLTNTNEPYAARRQPKEEIDA